MSDAMKGQCFCGGVRFAFPREKMQGAVACHCRDCQQMHGNYNAMAAVDRDALVLEESSSLRWFAEFTVRTRTWFGVCWVTASRCSAGVPW